VPTRDHIARVRVPLPDRVRGSTVHVEVLDVREVSTTDWYSEHPITMPIAIAELGLPATVTPGGGVDGHCRRNLVTIDGRAVGLRVVGDRGAGERRDALDVELCGPDLSLDAGEHELRAAPGSRSGLDVDRLVLTSAADGTGARPPAPAAPPRAASDVDLRVVSSGRDTTTVEVDADEPFWLVLGQSHSSGWQASGLGEPTLVDGYANGWYVEPDGDGPTRITMRFAPQRAVDVALLLSVAGALACIAIIAVSWRRRTDGPDRIETSVTWVWPWDSVGSRPTTRRIASSAIAVGAVTALVVHPVAGVALAVATALGLVLRRGPGVLATAAVVSLGGAALFTLAKQWRNHYPPDFGWPSFFTAAHDLAWVALALTAASVVAGAARRRAAPPASPPPR
jgi:hypothetical protein